MKRVPRRRGASQAAPARPAVSPKTAARPKTKERLDVALVARGLAPTREKAARLIMAGNVEVNGRRADKAGVLIEETAPVVVAQQQKFVSRGGDKLAPVLYAFNVSPRGRICVDVGASTGGFTHCLLERGASRASLARPQARTTNRSRSAPTLRLDGVASGSPRSLLPRQLDLAVLARGGEGFLVELVDGELA